MLSVERVRLGFIFFLGLIWFVNVRIIADVFIAELLLLVALPFLLIRYGRAWSNPIVNKIIIFGLLWFVSQMVTDIIRETELTKLARGWLAILFFLGNFYAVYLLIRGDDRRLLALIIGYALGGILRCFIDPGYGFDVEPWKFGFGFPTMILALLAITRLIAKGVLKEQVGLGCLLLLGVFSIYLNARSLGGVMVLAVLMVGLSKSQLFQVIYLVHSNPAKKTGLIALVGMMIFIILVSYRWAGEAKVLPENAQYKYDLVESSSMGAFGVILAGRSELLASIPAVADSPFIGHGSWAEDSKYRLYLYEIGNLIGVERDEIQVRRVVEEKESIPAHSHLMQSWVWAGFLGALFWLFIFRMIVEVTVRSMRYRNYLSMLGVFICVKSAWDLLFSPFGSTMRMQWAWELNLMILLLMQSYPCSVGNVSAEPKSS